MAALAAEDVRFVFQPLINLATGGIIAVEALPRGNIPELVPETRHQRRLRELDWWLAVSALRAAAGTETRLPVHINVLATALARDRGGVDWLRASVAELGRQARDVTVEVGPPFDPHEFPDLVSGIHRLRAHGFGIALEEVGEAALPLTLIADIRPDVVKLAPTIVRGLGQRSPYLAVVESVRHLCQALEADLLAPGVDHEHQLAVLRRNGIRMVQGNLLARPARRPPTTLHIPGIAVDAGDTAASTAPAAGPRVTEFLTPATFLPQDVVADVVRQVFADQPDISGVVLVDEQNRPQWTIGRNRFLLAVTGPYGYALHAKRPAARLADRPKLVSTTTTAMEALSLLAGGERRRSHDDAVVVDEAGHCLGVVQASVLVRGMTELKAEQAAALNPLTRLPGSDSVAHEVAQRIVHGCEFAVGWLDIDDFKMINDTAGFSAGDSVIRGVARSLADAAATLASVRVAHVGGDDFLLVANPADLPSLAAMVLDRPRRIDDLTVSLSLATLICAPNTITSYDDVSHRLAPLKRRAKAIPGSSWVQSRSGTHWVEILRGRQGSHSGRESIARPAAEPETQQRAATAPARQIS